MKRLLIALAMLLVGLVPSPARDMTGLSAQLSPEQGDWVRGLKDKRGVPCCDTADGYDVPWEGTADGGYRVLIEGQWRQVPFEALRDDIPNKIGVARVWYWRNGDEIVIRCFLPGGGT